MFKKLSKKKQGICLQILVFFLGFLAISLFSSVLVIGRKNAKIYADINTCIVSNDGFKLSAREEIRDPDSHKWVILVHSYGADHSMMTKYANQYWKMGYNTLSPDNRAHGSSEGQYIGMGYLDQEDILDWIYHIVEIDSDAEIVLHGISMGAACVMLLASNPLLPENVKWIIEDSGYKSGTSYIKWKLKQKYHLPSFPFFSLIDIGTWLLAGYKMEDVSALKSVYKSKIPILFIHGEADKTVPVEDAYNLYEVARCKKEIFIVENAEHGENVNIATEQYWSTVFSWISSKS